MTSRERVQLALSHKEPDRVPMDLGATNVTGINVLAYSKLLDYLGIKESVEIIDQIQGLAKVSFKVRDALGIDTYGVSPRASKKSIEECRRTSAGDSYFTDEWGLVRLKPKDGLYFDVISSPLSEIDPNRFDIEDYDWPDKNDQSRLSGLVDEIKYTTKTSDQCIVLGETLDFFLFACWLRGFENFLTDLYIYPDFAYQLLRKINDIQIARTENTLKAIGHLIDVVGVIGDDWGTQNSLYVSEEIFNQFFKPEIYRMIKIIRKYTDVPIFAHSCGAISSMIPTFIELGFNILNPIQVSAKGMDDTAALKSLFGDEIVFWGGGIDTQRILSKGPPDVIRDEVKKRISDLAPGGGYIFCPVHNIQADVPPENIVCAYKTAENYGTYPISQTE